jgi:hypothetical protein
MSTPSFPGPPVEWEVFTEQQKAFSSQIPPLLTRTRGNLAIFRNELNLGNRGKDSVCLKQKVGILIAEVKKLMRNILSQPTEEPQDMIQLKSLLLSIQSVLNYFRQHEARCKIGHCIKRRVHAKQKCILNTNFAIYVVLWELSKSRKLFS